ncbi:MAG: hypothetical protein HS115_12745 [Spirochaetales bacterium]|nr:hypothetical protein [Spirochaetales bacterium]
MKPGIFFWILVLLPWLSRCAFLRAIDLKPYPAGERQLFIQNIRNETFQADANLELTEWVRRELHRRGNFLIAGERNQARLILSGTLEVYRREGRMLDDYRNPVRYELILAARMHLRRVDDSGQSEIGQELLAASVEYSELEGYIETEHTARQRALQLLSARIAHFAEQSFVNFHGSPRPRLQ